MPAKNNKPRRAIATLKLPHNAATLIGHATNIVTAMTGNPHFPNPNPPLAAVQTGINALQTAQVAALTRAHGAVAVRDEKRQALVTMLEEERAYIQTTADTNPEAAGSIIQSAGLALRKAPNRPVRGFHAKVGAVSGTVKVSAPSAAARASYEWQYSNDGGKTWIGMPTTLQAKTSLTGQTPQATLLFRYRAVTKTGEGDWSPTTSVLVA